MAEVIMCKGFLEAATVLDKASKAQLIKAMWLLSENFRHPSLQCKPIQGSRNIVFEARVNQDLRLIYDCVGPKIRCWYVGAHDVALSFGVKLRSERSNGSRVEDVQVSLVPDAITTVIAYIQKGEQNFPQAIYGMSELELEWLN